MPMIVRANWTDITVEGAERVSKTKGREEIWRASAIARTGQRRACVIAYVCKSKKVGGRNDMGKTPYWREKFGNGYSKAYSTATEQASFDCASWPCCRRLCRVGKKASQAGHECMSSKETEEDTLEEEPDERERLDTLSSLSRTSSISSNLRFNDIESDASWGDCSRQRSMRFILPEKVSGCDAVLGDRGTSISSSEEQYDEWIDSSSSSSTTSSSSWFSSKDDDDEEVYEV